MTEPPAFASVPDPHWWEPQRDTTSPAASDEDAPAESVGADIAGSALPFWALLGFTFVLLIAPQNIVPALAPLRLGMVAAGTALGAMVIDRLGRGLSITRVTPEIKIAGCLLAWAIVTLPFSYWPGGSYELLTELYLKTLAIFLLIANVVTTTDRLRKVAWAITLMSIPIALTGIDNFLSGVYVGGGVDQAIKRIVGYEAPLTQNPNDLAIVLNLILPLTVALFLITSAPILRIGLFGVMALQVVAVVVTWSRTGFLALMATFIVAALTSSGRLDRRWTWGVLILAVVCLPLLPADYVTHLFTITNIDADPTGSAQGRWEQQVAALGYVMAHPLLGAGIGQNVLAMNEVLGPMWRVVHNAFLQYAIDLGLPGLILYLLLFAGCVRSAGRAARLAAEDPGARDLRILASMIRVSLLAFVVSAVLSPVAYHFHFYYFAGLALAALAIAETSVGTTMAEEPLADLTE